MSGQSARHYKRDLRIIGRYLNQRRARGVTVAEITGGYLLHFYTEGRLDNPEGYALQSEDLLHMEWIFRATRGAPTRQGIFGNLQTILGVSRDQGLQFQRNHPLLPEGYEQTLRTLGSRIDAQGGQAIMITESPTEVLVNYVLTIYTFAPKTGHRVAAPSRKIENYDRAGLIELMRVEQDRTERDFVTAAQRIRVSSNDYHVYLDAGRMFLDEGDYDEAAELYEMILKAAPKNVAAYYRFAELELARGSTRQAIEWLQRALQVDKTHAESHDLLGIIYQRTGQLQDALAEFKLAASYDSLSSSIQNHLNDLHNLLYPEQSFTTNTPHLSSEYAHDKGSRGPEVGEALPTQSTADDMDSDAWERETLTREVEPTSSWKTPVGDDTAHSDRAWTTQETTSGSPGVSLEALPPDNTPTPVAEISGTLWTTTDKEQQQQSGNTVSPVIAWSADREGIDAWIPSDLPIDQMNIPDSASSSVLADADRQAVEEQSQATGTVERDEDDLIRLRVAEVADEQLKETITRLERVLARSHGQTELHRKLGFLLARQGRTAEAAAEFRKARGD